MNRRTFIGVSAAAMAMPWSQLLAGGTTQDVFRRVYDKALEEGWIDLSIGDLAVAIGQQFLGTPYVGGTLEGTGGESCKIDLQGLDCVTFFENALCMARMLKLGGESLADMREEVTFTRYRGGVLDGYLSRLHYTAEWISDNVSKGVVRDITPELGGEPLAIDVHFMSQNPTYYPQLKANPALVERMARIESVICRIPRTFIPKERIADIEGRLRSGDIVAIATSKKGLDYAHTGMIYRKDDGSLFMHASSTQKKVVLDKRLSEVVAAVSSHTGVSIVRPVEP